MNSKNWIATLVGLAAFLMIATEASAYYHVTLGRFVGRDPIGYDAGDTNLYRYVSDNPMNWVDPSGREIPRDPIHDQEQEEVRKLIQDENFYVCSRLVEGEGCDAKAGCQHTDIYGDKGGEIYDGWFGPVAPTGSGLPKGEGWECTPLEIKETYLWGSTVVGKKFSWGPKAGKSCKNATPADVKACLQAKPKPPGEPGLVSNCQTDVYGAFKGCCLEGSFVPLSIIPVITQPLGPKF